MISKDNAIYLNCILELLIANVKWYQPSLHCILGLFG